MQDEPRSNSPHPLGMTVYDLPSPVSVAQADANRTGNGRLRMLLVLLVCAAPVLASYFTYYVVRPEGRRNFGDLIEPMLSLPDVAVTRLNGETLRLPSLKGQWLLISTSGGDCQEACQRQLYLQRQILAGLGKDRARTEWVWLVADAAEIPPSILPGLKDANVLRIDAPSLSQWLQAEPSTSLEDHLYLVDPHGQWMMRFPAKLSMEGALKTKRDIERLLRASAAWDEAGR